MKNLCTPSEMALGNFVPRLISWNLTFRCNLRCAHCYMDAREREGKGELNTGEGKLLIDQIAEVSPFLY